MEGVADQYAGDVGSALDTDNRQRGRMVFQGCRGRWDMSNVLIHKARELKPQTRAAVEAELGRALKDDEDVSIMAFGTHDAPAIEARSRGSQKAETDRGGAE